MPSTEPLLLMANAYDSVVRGMKKKPRSGQRVVS
jgi:hypothetical protein